MCFHSKKKDTLSHTKFDGNTCMNAMRLLPECDDLSVETGLAPRYLCLGIRWASRSSPKVKYVRELSLHICYYMKWYEVNIHMLYSFVFCCIYFHKYYTYFYSYFSIYIYIYIINAYYSHCFRICTYCKYIYAYIYLNVAISIYSTPPAKIYFLSN